jgi:hypothetical protein
LNWCFEPFERDGSKISKRELTAYETLRRRVNDQLIGFCKHLKASSTIGGFAENRPFLGDFLPDEFADHDLASGDPDSCSYFNPLLRFFSIERLRRIQNS